MRVTEIWHLFFYRFVPKCRVLRMSYSMANLSTLKIYDNVSRAASFTTTCLSLSVQYPELEKHYPGTWRVVGPAQLDKIVDRLTHSTTAHKARTNEIRERSAYVRFVVDTEKAKDIEYHRTRSANPRLEGNTCSLNSSQDFRQKKRRDNRKWDDPTHWAHPRLTTSALPALSWRVTV